MERHGSESAAEVLYSTYSTRNGECQPGVEQPRCRATVASCNFINDTLAGQPPHTLHADLVLMRGDYNYCSTVQYMSPLLCPHRLPLPWRITPQSPAILPRSRGSRGDIPVVAQERYPRHRGLLREREERAESGTSVYHSTKHNASQDCLTPELHKVSRQNWTSHQASRADGHTESLSVNWISHDRKVCPSNGMLFPMRSCMADLISHMLYNPILSLAGQVIGFPCPDISHPSPGVLSSIYTMRVPIK